MLRKAVAEASGSWGFKVLARTSPNPLIRLKVFGQDQRRKSSGHEQGWRINWEGLNRTMLHAAAASTLAGAGSSVLCASAEEVKAEQEQANTMIDAMAPLMGQATVGSVMGYAAGYALRVVGNMAAFAVGCAFICLQSAAYSGYIEVNWEKSTKDVRTLLDMDGDGDFDHDDVKILASKFIEVCTYNLPSGAGFTAGLALGLGLSGKTAAVVGTASLVPRVIAMGTTATAGPGLLVSMKEYSDLMMSEGNKVVKQLANLSPEDSFQKSIAGLGLTELRSMEAGIKKEIDSASSPEAKAFMDWQIKLIETAKAEVKKAK